MVVVNMYHDRQARASRSKATVRCRCPPGRGAGDGAGAWALLTSAPMLFIAGRDRAGGLVRHGQPDGQPAGAGLLSWWWRGGHHQLRPAPETLGSLVRPDRAQRLGVHGAGAGGHPGRRRGGDHPHGGDRATGPGPYQEITDR